jgi:nucleoside-triphosphatase THEP1
MIYIVSGPVDSGKTTRLREIFKTVPSGNAGGFLSAKLLYPNFKGYELVCLSKNIRQPLAVLAHEYKGQFTEAIYFQQFVFSKAAFDWGNLIIDESVSDQAIQNIFIDEIGPLELNEQGFCQAFKQALGSGKNIYVAIRSSCLLEIISVFHFKDYIIIEH